MKKKENKKNYQSPVLLNKVWDFKKKEKHKERLFKKWSNPKNSAS